MSDIKYQIRFNTFAKYCKYMDPAPRKPYTDSCKKKGVEIAYYDSYDCERKTCPLFLKLKRIM